MKNSIVDFLHLFSHNPFPMKYIVGEGFFRIHESEIFMMRKGNYRKTVIGNKPEPSSDSSVLRKKNPADPGIFV
ncbi:MAG: hypothetical protein Q8906_02375 [Bacillota bacterium]|nr:hypothetical protein [Bacillota bacterium]